MPLAFKKVDFCRCGFSPFVHSPFVHAHSPFRIPYLCRINFIDHEPSVWGMDIKIFHNPRCSKSRETLAILREKGAEVEIREYLKEMPSAKELKEIIQQLGIRASDLIRTSEPVFKENYKGRKLSDEAWIEAMIAHPKLMQRPIVIHGNKAVLGRPPERVLELF